MHTPYTDTTAGSARYPGAGGRAGDTVRLSHQRSAAFGLRTGEQPDASPLSQAALGELLERNRSLGFHALPAMDNLYAQIAGTRSMVLLTDRAGVILHSVGDADFLARAQRVALRPGVAWSEERKGTNAIGTALAEGMPTQIHAQEHYLQANHFLTCSCAPIFDPLGELLGALDVSGDYRSQGKHTLALVRMSAQMVENQLFASHFEHAVQVHFHARPEFLGTLLEGVAAFDAQGRFLAANRSAQFQLGMQLGGLHAHTFSSLFGAEMASLLAHCDAASPALLTLHVPGGVKVVARAHLHRRPGLPQAVRDAAPAPAAVRAPAAAASAAGAPSGPGLQALRTGDPQIAQVVDRLARVAGRDIPVLVLGETGTGKELLARAIHHDSPRRGQPLVAVNCASIPESLIESELFGYEEGAFTGARRKGSIGRIAQAHGGTLFLDEIGDMPLPLQARLLRVLQEREVVPLGGSRPLKVDVALVCATHRDLRAMRAAGTFRDDLYWRINGFVARLPALRERSDIADIARQLLRTQARPGTAPLALDAGVLALFAHHPWPGNIRQLASVLQTAALLAEGEGSIRREHLPEDFLDDAGPAPVQGAQGALAAPACSQAPDLQADLPRLQQVADSAIHAALEQHGGNVSAAARALGVARNTVYRRMRRH